MAGKRLTKAQIITELANATDLDKKTVNRLFDELFGLIKKQLGNRGPGEFVVPGLVKLRVVKKAATKERQGINPFTKEPMTIPAKPATKKIRATPLKALKDLV
jgi:DNA-binding protein HU-beta